MHYLFEGSVLSFNKELKSVLVALGILQGKRTVPDHLCGLVVRVSGYRYRGLGFDSRRYQIF